MYNTHVRLMTSEIVMFQIIRSVEFHYNDSGSIS